MISIVDSTSQSVNQSINQSMSLDRRVDVCACCSQLWVRWAIYSGCQHTLPGLHCTRSVTHSLTHSLTQRTWTWLLDEWWVTDWWALNVQYSSVQPALECVDRCHRHSVIHAGAGFSLWRLSEWLNEYFWISRRHLGYDHEDHGGQLEKLTCLFFSIRHYLVSFC